MGDDGDGRERDLDELIRYEVAAGTARVTIDHTDRGNALTGAMRDRVAGDIARTIRSGWQGLIAAVLDCEKPVIAAVNGKAAGGGAQLVLACDLVVMAETAKLAEVRAARHHARCRRLLPAASGWSGCTGPRSCSCSARLPGGRRRAHRPGQPGGTGGRPRPGRRRARRLAQLPTRALAMTKRLANRSFESSREQSFDDEAFF